MPDTARSPCHWFFDLEETLVRSWSNPVLVNLARVREFLERHAVQEIHVFSFAIYDAEDQVEFVRSFKPHLERALNVRILSWPCVDELCQHTVAMGGPALSRLDYLREWGKVRAFVDHVRSQGFSGHAVLVDDAVPDVVTVERRSGHMVECLNVDNLEGWAPLRLA